MPRKPKSAARAIRRRPDPVKTAPARKRTRPGTVAKLNFKIAALLTESEAKAIRHEQERAADERQAKALKTTIDEILLKLTTAERRVEALLQEREYTFQRISDLKDEINERDSIIKAMARTQAALADDLRQARETLRDERRGHQDTLTRTVSAARMQHAETAVSKLTHSAPGRLDTLSELAAAI